jgi:hypothetical protein
MSGRRILAEDWDAWGDLFNFACSAYRLETLPSYDEPDEAAAVARFLTGQDPGLDTSWWESMVRTHLAAGRTLTRVRILVEPLSDYARFQLPYYGQFSAAGEDIRVIAVPQGGSWPHDVPRHDYWLFDDRDVWVMYYTPAGTFTHAELADPVELCMHQRWRDSALSQAIPLATYRSATRLRAS